MYCSVSRSIMGRLVLTSAFFVPFMLLSAVSMTDEAKPFVARWALDLPGGGAGWLGVEQKACGTLSSSLLWGAGSPITPTTTKIEDGQLVLTRNQIVKKEGKETKRMEVITAKAEGPRLMLTTCVIDENGNTGPKKAFTGKRIPDLPARPDLKTLTFGTPIRLLGATLEGWEVMNKNAYNGWTLKEGVLSNRVIDPNGKNLHGTNLRTTAADFEDFNLKTEVRMSKDGNSGIYLRGIYEIQMRDSFGKAVDCHNMGALYGRITPIVSAEKPAGEWQTLDITLCDRHVTVILNDVMIIDNQPVLGCTGGAITSDEFIPGPIYLQGDHSNVDYRNMVLTPIRK